MKVAISDANILIDLFNINLLETFINLNLEINTTDFVMKEVDGIPEQKAKIAPLVLSGGLKVNVFSNEELLEVIQKNQTNNGVSIEDCSVWYWAEQNNAIILTGDRRLRNAASNSGIEVHGSLWVLDEFVKQQTLTKQEACKAIKELILSNGRLPKKECDKRVGKWCI